jgi:hypothetical protein
VGAGLIALDERSTKRRFVRTFDQRRRPFRLGRPIVVRATDDNPAFSTDHGAMDDRMIARFTGAAAVLAGLALSAASYVQSTLPIGCVGDECSYRPMRPDSAAADACYVVTLVALVLAALGLGLLLLRRRALGRLGAVAVGLIAVGAIAATLANLVQAAFFHGDLHAMPAIFLPSVAAVVIGLAVLMVLVIRARLVPLWAGALVGLSVLLVPFGNEENTTVLLDIPLGLAMALAGALIVRRGAAAPTSATAPRSGALV